MGFIINRNTSQNIKLIVFFLVLITYPCLYSCNYNENESGQDCFNCRKEKPDSAYIIIKVTINKENHNVPVSIYKGEFNPHNQSNKIDSAIVDSSALRVKMPVNEYYSVKAEYKSDQKIIYAVDGGVFETQKRTDCDYNCWQLIGGNYNVRLIY